MSPYLPRKKESKEIIKIIIIAIIITIKVLIEPNLV